MRTIIIALVSLAVLGPAAVAADQPPVAAQPVAAAQPGTPVATWTQGEGTIDKSSATPGSTITIGQRLASTAKQPAKVYFAAPLAGSLTLSPDAALTLVVETVADTQELVIELEAGAVQVDLLDKGGFANVRVRGAALDIRVTGTLFVVQRVKRDSDYVALVQGKLSAGLRKEVAEALGQGQRFDIDSRQGIGASTSGGLEQIASLTNRPQIASLKSSIKDQATGDQEGDGGWDKDLARDLLNDLTEKAGRAEQVDTAALEDALLNELTDALGEALFDDLEAGPGDQVIDTVFSGPSSPGSLGAPPPPPPVN